jgi:sugar/nucleoside kinase (ribokinase family)
VRIGGVGNRIYRGLATEKRFLTALGDDPLSAIVARELSAVGAAVLTMPGAGPPLYLALMEEGRLAVGAADVAAAERIGEADVLAWLGDPPETDMLVLEGNLAPGLVAALVWRFARRMPVVFEPVSVEKAARHRENLRDLFLVTPDEPEAATLAGGDAADLPAWMAERCIAHALVTRGSHGATLFSAGERREYAPGRVVAAEDTTGAGDQLVASLLDCLAAGAPPAEAVRTAMDDVERLLAKGVA